MSESFGKSIGIVAGNGIFPIKCIESGIKSGCKVVVAAHFGETDQVVTSLAEQCRWFKVGQLGKIISFFRSSGVERVVFAGGINRIKSFTGLPFDWRAIKMVGSMRSFGDDALLRAIAKEFEKDGMVVVAPTELVKEWLPTEGLLTTRDFSERELDNAVLGWEAAEKLGSLDIGQTVIAYNNLIIAIEAAEGTDKCIARAGSLSKTSDNVKPGKGMVLVKRVKPNQDTRLDLPSVGVETIRNMHSAGITALALEADNGVLLDPQAIIADANKCGVAIRVFKGKIKSSHAQKNHVKIG